MKTLFALLSLAFPLAPALAVGTVSSGGGGMIVPRPVESTVTPALGTYRIGATVGWSSGNLIRLSPANRGHLELQIGREGMMILDARFTRQADGSLTAEAIVEGRCPAKLRIVSLDWPDYPAMRGSVKLQKPFWLGDYLYTPEKYGHRCEVAANAPEHQNAGPTYEFYDLQ